MSEPFIGEIRMFAGTFAPRGWALCDGQLIAVNQNDALFSLLGTMYGGDGRTTFGLPDMRGRIPLHTGQGPGLTNRNQGAKGGSERVTLTQQNLPSHTHSFNASNDSASSATPDGKILADTGDSSVYITADSDIDMYNNTLSPVGGSRSHENTMPYLCISFIIALVGIYPSRQ